MIMKKLLAVLALCFLTTLVSAKPAVATYQVGNRVKSFQAKDKNGVKFGFKKGIKFLLVSFDMKTGKKANKLLHAKGAAYLTDKKAVYVTNIYGMPKIGRAFALPKLKRYAHPIILADAKGLLDPFPTQSKRVTILKLDSSAKIISIIFWDPATTSIDQVLK